MSSSASSTESRWRPSRVDSKSLTRRFERAVARVLVVALVGMTPGSAFASEEFPSADAAQMLTPGSIDQSLVGETTITSFVEDGQTLWSGGLDLPAGHTLNFDLLSDDSTHWNYVGGDFTAHIDGTVTSGPNNTLVFASPFGVFIGSDAVIDVGSLVAVGADLLNHDLSMDGPVLDLTGPIENQGLIRANADVLLYGTGVRNTGEILARNGQILMLGADAIHFFNADTIAESLIRPLDFVAVMGLGTVENQGRIAAPDVSLLGGQVANHGEINIADGSLMMIGADAVYVSQFNNPVLIRLPHATSREIANPDDPDYRVENHGQIDAGLGHVRLAASDPLGWGIRQGKGGRSTSQGEASIVARQIEIEGGEDGRVLLAGGLDASGRDAGEVGGEIDITGSAIALIGATIDASGDSGGGTIQIGGEQQGRGELQRAEVLVMNEASSARADALREGDGGRVILFSEDFTAIGGELSARGGDESGNGGFIETSGLRSFQITQTPDASAPNGHGGEWLVDPYAINIVADTTTPDCGAGNNCLNSALEAILAPNFDSRAFDGILRTVSDATFASANDLSVDLLIRALVVGTNVTLSTEAFNPLIPSPTEGDGTEGGAGDIVVAAPIEIRNGEALTGTRASLTLLAAGSIYVNEDISVRDAGDDTTPDLSLDLEFRANDQSQRDVTLLFGTDQLRGSVEINANIRTGGGDLVASGVGVSLADSGDPMNPFAIETDGGAVMLTSGSLNRSQDPGIFQRLSFNPEVVTPGMSADPSIRIAGTIDTSRPDDDPDTGGDISLLADALLVSTAGSPTNLLQLDTGLLELTGSLSSGGGNISLEAGATGTAHAGSIQITNGRIMSQGGDVTIDAHRVDSLANNGVFDVTFVDDSRGEGGSIVATAATDGMGAPVATVATEGGTLTIGSSTTQQISLDGIFDTTGGAASEDGLISIVALDTTGADSANLRYGRGEISIGENDATTIRSAGIRISTRDLTTALNGDAVSILAIGSTTAVIPESGLGVDSDTNSLNDISYVSEGEVVVAADRQILFYANTAIEADTITISAAPNPSLLNGAETNGVGDMLAAEPADLTRLTLFGTGGTDATTGVRLAADDISISIGDGTTITPDLVFEETDDGTMTGTPNAFGLERGTRGNYAGLQLRDRSGSLRPETLSIRQDGDLSVVAGATTTDAEIFFGGRSDQVGPGTTTGAFANASIGDEGQSITLESSDGTLTIEDAAGLSNDLAPTGLGENGLSQVVLNGGLLLPPDAMSSVPASDSVVFSGSFLGNSAFNIDALTVSTPRALTITTQFTDAIASAADLVFQAGRNTGVSGAVRDATLTVADGLLIQSSDRLAIQAAASGVGNLVFEGTTTTLAANDLELRAGAGRETSNSGQVHRPAILNLQNVNIRNAANGDFVSTGTTELSFSFRQDAAIDAATHLPTLANFASTPITSFNGPGAITPVAYSLRSDFGTVDLMTDVTDGARFRDAALSLIGLQTTLPAIQTNPTFSFIGPSIELGGVSDFIFTPLLADAFNPTNVPAEARELVRLRGGLNGAGTLYFTSGVTVKAPTIELVAGDGAGGTAASRVTVAGAQFDLSDAAAGERTFLYQEDENFQLFDLPTAAQFIGGLPNILAIRDDGGAIDLTGFVITSLPIDLSVQARLILEADSVELFESGGPDLVLSTDVGGALENLGLRIRANTLRLEALFLGTTIGTGRVLAGSRTGDTTTASTGPQSDSAFSSESLLIEAFDPTREIATTTNLSTASEVEDDPTMFDLSTGRGPTLIVIDQDGAVDPTELPNRFVVSGYLERTLDDEADGTPIATTYDIDSRQVSILLAPDNVSGSNLVLGEGFAPLVQDITFATGSYDFDNLGAYTAESIFVQPGVSISSADSIVLAAAVVGSLPLVAYVPIPDAMGRGPMGKLVFEDIVGPPNTTLSANRIELSAGPPVTVLNPDATAGPGDGDRDPVNPLALAEIDFRGLFAVNQTGASETSFFLAQQSRAFLIDPAVALNGDLSSALQTGTGVWDTVDLSSVQGRLTLANPELLDSSLTNLTLGRAQVDSSVVVVTDVADPFSIAGGFNGQVRVESNDIAFLAADGIELQLDTPNLRLVSETFLSSFAIPEELARIRSDPDAVERPILRVEQSGDFSTTTLVRADRYLRRTIDPFSRRESEVERESLAEVDIELTTRGDDLVLGDTIRDGASFSNLILRTNDGQADVNGNIAIRLTGLTPGFTFDDFSTPDLDATDFAALQLASLDLNAGAAFDKENRLDLGEGRGTITIEPFEVAAVAEDLTITTTGDQRFSGRTVLQETLSTNGRDIRFTGDVYRGAGSSPRPDAGLIIQTDGEVIFEEDIGTSTDAGLPSDPNERLGKLWVLFDTEFLRIKPTVQFGNRIDIDGDGVPETAVASDQRVLTDGDIVFMGATLGEPDDSTNDTDGDFLERLQTAIEAAATLDDIALALASFGIGRIDPISYATIGKSSGALSFQSFTSGSHFVMGSGERLSVGGTLDIDVMNSVVTLGDVSALDLSVNADEIGLVARNAGTTIDAHGASFQDPGSAILANTIDFGGVAPRVIGSGKLPRFGVVNPFDRTLPAFLGSFSVFAILPNGGLIDASLFSFDGTALADQVPSLAPLGASRSELTGAYGPTLLPRPSRDAREVAPLRARGRLVELGVDAEDTPKKVVLARLEGAAIIDDLAYAVPDSADISKISATDSRLDAKDAESAIALYDELFGPNGERAGAVRDILQGALDQYLETTRARRVVGFELRRYVKNRPSSLLEAYRTLEQLDALFRYHRRLGLSPGEFRRIQRGWLIEIQPDGITLDELAEAIHPSRYVRGSDILDIFGR